MSPPISSPADQALKGRSQGAGTHALLLCLLLLIGFGLRSCLAIALPGHPIDINAFYGWCLYITQYGPFAIYHNPSLFCDYPPLYLLILNGIGWVVKQAALQKEGITFLLKLPAILADLGCALLIYRLLAAHSQRLAWLGLVLTLFHPVALYDSVIWGQIDSITLLLQLISMECLIRRQHAAALGLTALNILIKPQGIVLLPLILAVAAFDRAWLKVLSGSLLGLAAAFLVTLPFSESAGEAIPLLWSKYIAQANLYPFSALQSFNLWGLTGMWQADHRGLFGGQPHAPWFLQHRSWGLLLFGLAVAGAIVYCRRLLTHQREQAIWLSAALLLIAFFMLPTRMHERYLYSGLFFLLPAIRFAPRLWIAFAIYSLTLLLNLSFEFPGQELYLLEGPGKALNQLLIQINQVLMPGPYLLVILVNLAVFAWLCRGLYLDALPERQAQPAEVREA